MQEYCEKIKLPFTSTFRKWISNLNGPENPQYQQQQQSNSNIEDTKQKELVQDTTRPPPIMINRETAEKTIVGNLITSSKDSTLTSPSPSSSSSTKEVQKDVKNVTFKEPEYTKNSQSQSQDSPRKYTKISKAQMKEFREAFGFFDKDGDGSITKDELGIVMRSLGQFASEDELKEMLKEVDIDGDGMFSFDEFVQIVTNYAGSNSVTDEEQELRDAFRIFDKHNRGYISASDLRAVLHCLGENLSEDEIEDMLKEVDVDGDGRIDFNEFVKALGEPDDPDTADDEVDIDTQISLSQP